MTRRADQLPALDLDIVASALPGLSAMDGPLSGGEPASASGGESAGGRVLSTDQAGALNGLMRRRAPLTLREGARQVAVHLLPTNHPLDGAPWLSVTVDGEAAAVALPWSVLRRVAGLPLEAALPEDAALLVEDALTPWLDSAERLTGLSLRFERLDRDMPALPGAVPLTLGIETLAPTRARQPLPLRLSVPAARRLAAAMTRWHRPRATLPQLFLRVAIELDSIRLPLAELRGLAPGDAVMLPQDAAPRPARAVIESRLSAPVQEDGAGLWRLLAPFSPRSGDPAAPPSPDPAPQRMTEMSPMTQPSDVDDAAAMAPAPAAPEEGTEPRAAPRPEPTPQAPLGALDDLQMRLSFRMGEALMSLTELREAGIGTVIALDRPDGAPVDIVLNGQVIGTGQIITVAGQRACEIVTLFGDG